LISKFASEEGIMSWRRGVKSIPVELANVQSKMESWSDVLDGEDGVIKSVQDDQAERTALRKFIKAAVWLGGLFVGLPSFALVILELVKFAKHN
jgi:hypothetical protein